MSRNNSRSKATPFFPSRVFLFVVGGALLMVWAIWSLSNPAPSLSASSVSDAAANCGGDKTSGPDLRKDPPDPNFYDDPELSYTIDTPPVKNWDEKRREWLKQHPSFAAGAENRILMVTGSQPEPCKNPIGDYLMLRLFKNKVEYCRRHGIDIFYNNVQFHPKMNSGWAKTPTVKAAMLAHPEAEWIWWVDSDAVLTDMDFEIPLSWYEAHNMAVHGWPNLIYEKKSWTSVNAGVFLIRNCQWSMDFMDTWAKMGPKSPGYDKWGEVLSATLSDKYFSHSSDQSALVYLLLKEKEKWGDKIYIENKYYFQGYWVDIVGEFDNIADKYKQIEKNVPALRRKHAEKVSDRYARVWEEYLKDAGYGWGSWRRPFITHFTGCQPCSGHHNKNYSGGTCYDNMQKALTFADNQVLRSYGFVHSDLEDPSTVKPLQFDYPV